VSRHDWAQVTYATILAGIVLFLTFTAGYWYRSTRPMPCTETQVQVWVDYPNDVRCVSNIDHAAHSGG